MQIYYHLFIILLLMASELFPGLGFWNRIAVKILIHAWGIMPTLLLCVNPRVKLLSYKLCSYSALIDMNKLGSITFLMRFYHFLLSPEMCESYVAPHPCRLLASPGFLFRPLVCVCVCRVDHTVTQGLCTHTHLPVHTHSWSISMCSYHFRITA